MPPAPAVHPSRQLGVGRLHLSILRIVEAGTAYVAVYLAPPSLGAWPADVGDDRAFECSRLYAKVGGRLSWEFAAGTARNEITPVNVVVFGTLVLGAEPGECLVPEVVEHGDRGVAVGQSLPERGGLVLEAGDLGVAAVGEVAGLLSGLEPGFEFLAEAGVGTGAVEGGRSTASSRARVLTSHLPPGGMSPLVGADPHYYWARVGVARKRRSDQSAGPVGSVGAART